MSPHELSPVTLAWQANGHYADALGMRIFVVNRGAGPTVLLLHGFPTSCYDWRAIVDSLAPSHRVGALDFPGYGLSDKPAAYSYSLFQQADVLESIARSLGIDEAHVVSHDVGTSIHTELLARARRAGWSFASRRPRSSTAACCNGSPPSLRFSNCSRPTRRCRRRSKCATATISKTCTSRR